MKQITFYSRSLLYVLILVSSIGLSSCSAVAYWWGERYEDTAFGNESVGAYKGTETIEDESPLKAVCVSLLSLLPGSFEANGTHIFVGLMWITSLLYIIPFFAGRIDDVVGTEERNYHINGKKYTVVDHSHEYTLKGTGSKERGWRWAAFCMSVLLWIVCVSKLFHEMSDYNLLIKLGLTAVITYLFYRSFGIFKVVYHTFCYFALVFCSIDFILGVLVSLWIWK